MSEQMIHKSEDELDEIIEQLSSKSNFSDSDLKELTLAQEAKYKLTQLRDLYLKREGLRSVFDFCTQLGADDDEFVTELCYEISRAARTMFRANRNRVRKPEGYNELMKLFQYLDRINEVWISTAHPDMTIREFFALGEDFGAWSDAINEARDNHHDFVSVDMTIQRYPAENGWIIFPDDDDPDDVVIIEDDPTDSKLKKFLLGISNANFTSIFVRRADLTRQEVQDVNYEFEV